MTRDGLTEENLRDGSVKDISHRSRGRPENKQVFYDLFEKVTEMQHWYEGYSDKDREFILHCHCQAVMGLLREWTKQDTENISYIVHQIYLLLMGKAVLVSDENNDL